MDVGIGLPSTIPGVERDQLLQWARRAEARGFSSLGTIDRLVYDNYEPLIALAAAAAHAAGEAYGAISLLISHRFSTARVADLIVLIENGRIVETGAHDELLEAGGAYAELYELQARAYRD